VYREKVIANQKKLGLIPANAQLPARNQYVKAWNTLSSDQKKVYARFMEIYAAYLTYIDAQVGRIVNHLKEIKQLDNTLFFVMIGDNGASKEGTFQGVLNKGPLGGKVPEDELFKTNLEKIGEIGTPSGLQTNYPLGWAQTTNTPFKSWKQDANTEGGTRNPLIIFYPKGIQEKGGIRNQYGHVVDILPTTLEFAGLNAPGIIKGIKQDTLQGTSLYYSVANANAPSKHTEQYYYIFGSRAVYKDGWKAAAAHHPDYIDLNVLPGKDSIDRNFDKDVWELYNVNEDFNERIDLAKKYPEKLKELQGVFDAQAKKYNIYPLIDWSDVVKRRLQAAKQASANTGSTNSGNAGKQ
jgi:arylsulfatase